VISGRPYDESSDVYSFGIIVYEIFSRCMPFSNIESLLVQKEVQLTESQVDTPEKLQDLGTD
jgi:serine/threonine protein kinase